MGVVSQCRSGDGWNNMPPPAADIRFRSDVTSVCLANGDVNWGGSAVSKFTMTQNWLRKYWGKVSF